MKKFFAIALLAGSLVACDNAGTGNENASDTANKAGVITPSTETPSDGGTQTPTGSSAGSQTNTSGTSTKTAN